MKTGAVVSLCLLHLVLAAEIPLENTSRRESRKLFGGYRITPHFCKPTRKPTTPIEGPSICMFNHECLQRDGQVVGACMDGFLFGACCQLPAGATGELIEGDANPVAGNLDNDLLSTSRPPSTIADSIMSSGVSQIAQSLLNPGILPTAQDNVMIQVGDDQPQFTTTGITHPENLENLVLTNDGNYINPQEFQLISSTSRPSTEDRKTTMRIEYSTVPYLSESPISISNGPSVYTMSPNFQKPMFRPRPPSTSSDGDKYVLVPTITHESRPNKTQEADSVVNIQQLLSETSTSRKPPSTSYIFTSSSTKRPISTTTRKPPSTSYVFSTTFKPRRTTTSLTTTKKKPSTNASKKPTKPTKTTNNKKTTIRPAGFSTVANSPSAFITTKKPPSTSYVYNAVPTRRPPSTVNTHIAGPGFTVTSSPIQYPSPAPTLIVLGPVTEQLSTTRPGIPSSYNSDTETIYPASPQSPYYPVRPSPSPPRRPINSVNSVTINNHVTQNVYSTSERPQPTVLITPKPSISTSLMPNFGDFNTAPVEVETSGDELINFPPVRNPNLNMSYQVINNDDITTPAFVEDEALDLKVESFVNKIIQGLQDPFEDLKDVVYSKNNRTSVVSGTTTRKPTKKQGTTTRRPANRPSSSRPSTSVKPAVTSRPPTRRPTTRRPTSTLSTRRPTSTLSTRRPTSTFSTRRPSSTTTTKRPRTTKTTRRPTTTTTQSYIEEDNLTDSDSDQYRDQCGIRPLLRTGRIVGGKAATFGEFPWQVLVREATWLGLFTKNKCGGVLISNRFVMTAAHCQPGFLASLIAVFGEFDISGDLESRRPISRNVKRVIVHRKYDAATFENDLALLELEAPIKFDAHIIPICLPNEDEVFYGRMATVTGWGRLKYAGGVPSVLQEVQVPIMENHVCQDMFRTAGHQKVILDSFLCAGYANGQRDSCEGDSGGPLVLQRPDGRYQLAGTVSHGIKCAAPYLPGVYMRTSYYKPWITAITGVQ